MYCYPFLCSWYPMINHVVNKPVIWLKKLTPTLWVFLFVMASCTGPGITPERYQTGSIGSEHRIGPVAELQSMAISAINQSSYPLAVEYLQRAIKIEPRNAFSWHYLAQTYWHSKQYSRCADMVKRSISYSSKLDDLDRANAALLSQCGGS